MDLNAMRYLFASNRLLIAAFVFLLVLAGARFAIALTEKEEIELGAKLHNEILKTYPLSKDEAAQKEVNEIGQRLVKGVKRTGIPYHFAVIDAGNDFNAFASPGGYIYFTQRLWEILRHDERVGVLGHEIVHVDNRHGIDAVSKAQKRAIWTAILLTILKANETWTNVADLANSLYSLKYSRGDERQADEQGIEIIRKAEMNPVGLLLAMRKIGRLQDEAGGQPPKILSSHPPTKERLSYITDILRRYDIPIPPEDIVEKPATGIIGTVIKVRDTTVMFSSSRTLPVGDVVWLMARGWDYYYEVREQRPIARAVVTSTSSYHTAKYIPIDDFRNQKLSSGMTVCHIEHISPAVTDGSIQPSAGGVPQLILKTQPIKYDRYLCYQTVWDAKNSKFISDIIGTLVIVAPDSSNGYVAIQRPGFAYAPITEGCELVKLVDKDIDLWIGPIVSIGRGSQTVEVMTDKMLRPDKTYDITHPAWNLDSRFQDRVVARARLLTTNKKIVLKLIGYTPGWSISRIANGFDVYEQAEESESELKKE